MARKKPLLYKFSGEEFTPYPENKRVKDSTINNRLLMELSDYQIEGVRFAKDRHYCAILDECGLGKTAQAIASFLLYGNRTVIVCPAYLKLNWVLEIQKFSKKKLNIFVVETNKNIPHPFDFDVIIMGYSNIDKCRTYFEWSDFVVVDEAHFAKTMGVKRTEALHKNIYECEPNRLIMLTGTPVENRVMELYSILCLASYNPRGTSGVDICDRYPTDYDFACNFSYKRKRYITTKFGRRKALETFYGIKNKDKLRELVKGKTIKRKAKDYLDLKKPIEKNLIVSFKNDPALEKEWQKFLEKGEESVDTKTKVKSAMAKVPYTCNLIEDLMVSEDCVLVFSDHREPAKAIVDKLGKKYKVGLITGEVDSTKRGLMAQAFQNGGLDIIVATIKSFCTGNTLTRSKVEVFNDFSWVPGNNEQAEGRIYRRGQEGVCTFYRVFGSIQDEKIWAANNEKKSVIENTPL